MDHELRISAEAERCIEEQLQWYEADEANGGAELADRWLDLLTAALESLARNPERHGFAPENGRWMPDIAIRQLRFKPWKGASAWRILYAIDAPVRRVTVLQIRHEKRPLLE
jgi:plasmid stabilization system protein ParE